MAKKTLHKQSFEKEIEEVVKELLKQLQIVGEVTVSKGEDNYLVGITSEETGLLIGHHGETINSLQLLVGIILYKKLKEWVRVVLDVGGYRKNREESVKEMVMRIVTEVETTGKEVSLPLLTPFERRSVHLFLTDHPTVYSESEGEGRERRLVIKPKKSHVITSSSQEGV